MNATTRIETDSIGELEVPAAALYGARTWRAVTAASFSGRTLGGYPRYVRALAVVKKAACRANLRAGVIDERIAAGIERACDALIRGEHLEHFPADPLAGGGGVAINMNANEVIANLTNEALGGQRGVYDPVEPKRHVNASQSTADACATAGRLAVLEEWEDVRDTLPLLGEALGEKAAELMPVRTVARTCLRDAGTVALGSLFEGYRALAERRTLELARAADTLRYVSLGGTVIGSGEGAPTAYRECVVAELSAAAGREMRRRESLFDAAQNIDDLAAFSAQLALLADGLAKIAQDLRLLASGPEAGFGEIRLPMQMEGSSFFPHKANPVVPESVLNGCFQVLACDRAVQLAYGRGELNLNVFEPVAVFNLLDAALLTARVLRLLAGLTRDIRADEQRCAELVERSRRRS